MLAILAVIVATAACDPFGLPSTRSLEAGAADMLSTASSYEISGAYGPAAAPWKIDLQFERPSSRHLALTIKDQKLEAIIVGQAAYFRGQEFLAEQLGDNPLAPGLVQAAGSAWWKGSASLVPGLPDFMDGATFRATFLGSAVTQRTDHQSVDGADAVELSGARADVYIASASPFHLLRVHVKAGAQIDGLVQADLTYSNVGKNFGITSPKDVIDFANLSTLPPLYSVESVDTSQCGSPCVVSARVRNLGGLTGARGPSTVNFTMRAPGGTNPLGSCSATVQPDVGYNATTRVSCTIAAQPVNGAVVTATADNPGRA
ncbi:MAG TPA: hypothetical protein VFL27_12890 [Candidatus Dormibacteraeota bacterium]|nr:hypothetical protein [Candidatus Dormibacteraeota bacterium]